MKIRRIKIPVHTINDLPEGVLYDIFYEIASDVTVLHTRLIFTLSNSWVCRKWRQIILESPAIWGHLLFFTLEKSFTQCPLVSTILERSGNSPLWIYGNTWSFILGDLQDRDPSAETIAARDALRPIMTSISTEYWERIERLSLRFYRSDLFFVGPSFFSAIVDRPAGQLRHFRLEIPDGSVAQVGIPPVFTGCSPVLGYFGLRGMRYMFEASSVARLRYLEFSDYIEGNTLRLLPRVLPLLEMCTIHDISKAIDEQNIVPIHLPKLRHLHVSGSPEACQAIVRNTERSSPAGCFVGFEFEIPQGHDLSSFDAASAFVQEFYEPLLLNNLELLEKLASRLEDIALTIYLNAFEIELSTGLDFPLKMSLFWNFMTYQYFFPPLLQALGRCAVYFEDVITLRLDSYAETIMRNRWNGFLQVFPNMSVVRTLYMNHIPFVYNFIDDVLKKSWSKEEKIEFLKSQPFPKLRKLSFFDVFRQDTADPEQLQSMTNGLLSNLSRRATFGVPIQEIELLDTPKHFVMPKEVARVAHEFPDLKIWSVPKGGSSSDRKLLSGGSVGARVRNRVRDVSGSLQQSLTRICST
ncbi:hypothetical protein CPC08DRAFT_411602 [Agrocybe pediades]|nr:hypothetical protein CPC08DRAFT_411602 [Agrocybe pediades]